MCKLPFILSLFLLINGALMGQAPTATQWTWDTAAILPPQAPAYIRPGLAGPVAGRLNHFLLVGGGANFPHKMPWEGGVKEFHRELFIYRVSASGRLRLIRMDSLPEYIAYAACIETPRGLLLAGGENASGKRSACFLLRLNPRSGTLESMPLPDLPQALTHAMICAWNNQVLLAGGETDSGTSAQVLQLDLNNLPRGWQRRTNLPAPVSDGVLLSSLVSGQLNIYLLGGRRRTPSGITRFLTDVWNYHPVANEWTACSPLPRRLAAGTGTVSPAGRIYLFGGDEGETYNQTEKLMIEASREVNPAKRDSIKRAGKTLQENHPGFNPRILEYDPVSDKWFSAGRMPEPVPVTTRACWIGTSLFIPLGEIRAGRRSRVIWRGRLKSEETHQHNPLNHAED